MCVALFHSIHCESRDKDMNRRTILFVVLAGFLLSLQAVAGPATAQKPAQATPSAEVRGRVVSDGLRVRSQPGNTSAQIDLLKAAALVTVLGKNTAGTWLLIRTETGTTGWVGSPYIALTQGTLKDVPVVSESTAVGTAAPTAAAATEAATEMPCPPAASTPGAETGATPAATSGLTGRVVSDGLRIRSLPSNTSAQIGLLKMSALVTVLGRNTSGTWLVVQTEDGLTGWVGSAYIALTSGQLSDIPVRDETQIQTPAATEGAALSETPCPPVVESTAAATRSATAAASTGVKGRVISSEGLRVRAQPSNTSAQIALLKAATPVTVIGKNANGTWLLVQADTGITGWVGSAFVALTEGSLKDVPLADESAPVATPSAPQ
jgi:uncharacterized protein YgiM (DUF1202 family)